MERKERRMEESGGGSSVKEECSMMYSVFVQVTVSSNAAVTHLKLALAGHKDRQRRCKH